MQKVIQTKGLARRFGSRWAYARIDFEVLQGERFSVIRRERVRKNNTASHVYIANSINGNFSTV